MGILLQHIFDKFTKSVSGLTHSPRINTGLRLQTLAYGSGHLQQYMDFLNEMFIIDYLPPPFQ